MPDEPAPPALPDPAALPAALPWAVRLQLDALEAFNHVVESLPRPGQGGALGRLNAGSWIVGHVASQQDQYWNVAGQGREPDPWIVAQQVRTGDPPTNPSYAEARAALYRAETAALPFLLAMTEADLARAPRRRTFGEMLARSVTHLYAHGGELAAIASLVGAPDLGLPGALRYTWREL